MSSTRLLTNFGVTWRKRISLSRVARETRTTHGWCTTVQIVQVLIEGIAVQLHGDDFLCSRVCDS